VLRVFYNWLYFTKSGYSLQLQDNHILSVDPPEVEKKILPSLTSEQVGFLLQQTNCVRDKAIISLFADSCLRLSELERITVQDIDWDNRLIKVWCRGGKEALAVFGSKTESLLRQWLAEGNPQSRNIWGID